MDEPQSGQEGLYELRVTDPAGQVVSLMHLDREEMGVFLEVLQAGLFTEGFAGPVEERKN